MPGIRTEIGMGLCVSSQVRTGIRRVALATVLLLLGSSPVFANTHANPVLVTGSIVTADGLPVGGLKITFTKVSEPRAPRNQPTSVKTNSTGKFALMLPFGSYDSQINERRTFLEKARCLATEFKYEVAGAGQKLDIVVPSKKDYSLDYQLEGSDLSVPAVRSQINKVTYSQTSNEELGNPLFYCPGLFIPSQPSGGFIWNAYEVAEGGVSGGTYMFKNALGQELREPFPLTAFRDKSTVVDIKDIPTIRLIKGSIRFSNKTFSGEAMFSEAPGLDGLDLERKFKAALGWKANRTLMISPKKFEITSGNRIRFSFKVINLYGPRPTLTLVGDGFSAASNSVIVAVRR